MSVKAKFTVGNITDHVMRMAITNAVGLAVFFVVDLLDIYFIGLLHQPSLTAALGYAAALLSFTTSFTIAMVIVNSVFIGSLIGQKKLDQAPNATVACACVTFLFSMLLSSIFYCNAAWLLSALGAQGTALTSATLYFKTAIFSAPIFALAMQFVATLRAYGAAKLAMLCLLIGGVVNVILTPLLIFIFHLGIEAIAWASIVSKAVILLMSSYLLITKKWLLSPTNITNLPQNIATISRIFMPVSLTQLAMPIGQLYLTYEMAKFGADSVAGLAIINRLIPVAFFIIFAMPGAIGPIISQNIGAQELARVRMTLVTSLNFMIKYVLFLALALSFLQEHLVTLFSATAETATLVRFFCQYIPISFIFVAINLITVSFLNNAGYLHLSTLLNLSRMTLGTLPFISLGAFYYGAKGILVGQALGSFLFAMVAIIICYKVLARLNSEKEATILAR